jgi:hypothetical protein
MIVARGRRRSIGCGGAEKEVLADMAPSGIEVFGIREDEWPDSPEEIAGWLNWYNTLEPLNFSDQERSAWETARREQKEFEKAKGPKCSLAIRES